MRSVAVMALLALSACAATPPPEEAGGGVCNADGLGQFVGQPASQDLGTAMLRTSGARTIRWVGHGMMVTMDFSPQRLTVYLTSDNRVERASCG